MTGGPVLHGEVFLASYRAARRPSELSRVRIDITASAAPQEVMGVLRHARGLPRQERRWLADLADQLTAEVPVVRHFERSDLAASVRLYRDASAEPTRSRTLLVAFAGRAQRLMLHLPVFLQHLPSEPYDVLLLTDTSRLSYRSGLPGVAGDLPGLTAWIAARRGPDHAVVQTFGTSMGGGPALLAALLLGAERGVSVGGGLERDEVESAVRSAERTAGGTAGGSVRPVLLAAFAQHHERDATRAERLAACLPGLVRVEIGSAHRHSVFEEVRQRGVLAPLLRSLLRDGVPADPVASDTDGPLVWFELPVAAPRPRAWWKPLVRSTGTSATSGDLLVRTDHGAPSWPCPASA